MPQDEEKTLQKRAEEALQFIVDSGTEFFTGASSQYICKRMKRDPHGGWRFVNLEDGFRLDMARSFAQQILENAQKSVTSLEFDSVTDDNMGVLPLASFSEFSDGIEVLPDPISEGATFTGDKEFLRKVGFFAIKLETETEEDVTCFMKAASDFYVEKAGAAWFKGDNHQFKKVADELVTFPVKAAFFVFRDIVFVVDERKFVSMTKFTEAIAETANKAFDYLIGIENIEIKDAEQFRLHLMRSVEFMRRLSSAYHAKALVDRDVNEIHSDIQEFELEVSSVLEDGRLKISANLDSRSGRRDVVDVLSDRITISRSSKKGYRVQKGAPLDNRGSEKSA